MNLSMKNQKEVEKLNALFQLMRALFEEFHQMASMIQAYPNHQVLRTIRMTDDMRESGLKVLAALKKPSPIKDIDDLNDVVFHVMMYQITKASKKKVPSFSSEDMKNIAVLISKRLDDPLQEYSFSTTISTLSNIGFNFEIGGRDKLKMKVISEENEPPRMALTGKLKVLTNWYAASHIELHIKHIIGLSLALKLAFPMLQRAESIPHTDIKGKYFEESIPLDPTVSALASMICFSQPPKDELMVIRIKKRGLSDVVEVLLEQIKVIMNTNDDHGSEIRSSARLLFDAIACFEAGKSIAFAMMSVEAALLESKKRSDILARLREAVAYRLGTSAKERSQLRRLVDELYSSRSEFVHTGIVSNAEKRRDKAIELATEVLSREVRDFD